MDMVFNKSVCLALIRALPDLVGGVRVCSAYDVNIGAGFCISASSLCGSGGNASSVFVDATYDGKRILSLVFANEAEALAGVRDMSWAILSGLEAIAVGLVANAPCLPVDASVGAVSSPVAEVKLKRGWTDAFGDGRHYSRDVGDGARGGSLQVEPCDGGFFAMYACGFDDPIRPMDFGVHATLRGACDAADAGYRQAVKDGWVETEKKLSVKPVKSKVGLRRGEAVGKDYPHASVALGVLVDKLKLPVLEAA